MRHVQLHDPLEAAETAILTVIAELAKPIGHDAQCRLDDIDAELASVLLKIQNARLVSNWSTMP